LYNEKIMPLDVTQQAEFVGQITRHQAMLRAYIISLMPGMDGVDDVLQETNLVLFEKFAAFQPGTNFRAWACAIARLEVKTHRRKLRRQGCLMLEEDLAEQLAEHTANQSNDLDERLRALNQCLGRLEENERELIEHRYFSKLTLEGFADRCGRPVESLRVSLFRIRAALRRCIKGELAINSIHS
jgi:RNA polymerase sigma-70 factor (ECF subfamily)